MVVVFIGEDYARRNPFIEGMCLGLVWTPHLEALEVYLITLFLSR